MKAHLSFQSTAKLAFLAGAIAASLSIPAPAIAQSESTTPVPNRGEPMPASEGVPANGTMPESEPDELEGGTPESPNVTPDDGMMPESESEQSEETENGNLIAVASSNEQFATLVRAIEAAGLTPALQQEGEGSYTILAPTEEAFAQLPEGTLEMLLMPQNLQLLQQILAYHIIQDEVSSEELETGTIRTFGGEVPVEVTSEGIAIGEASVLQADIKASNGVIHAIDRVLIPEAVLQQLSARRR